MIYKRHYVQFNDLVFDGYDMISDEDASTSFKVTEHEYTYRHGSFVPLKSRSMLTEAGEVSFTIHLRMKRLPCEKRDFYRRHAIENLTTPGKLWAVQGNMLVWAYAILTDYSEDDSKKDTLDIDVDFLLPEGVWHKADKQRTFLIPFDVCDFMDCYDYKDVNPCRSDCCHCAKGIPTCECCCDTVTQDMALCYHGDIQDFYAKCDSPYRIVYDCASAERFFGDLSESEGLGQRMCTDCGAIYGLLYSDTEIPTSGVKITLHGAVKDPAIDINGNINTIKGEFNGILEIYPDGSVYYSEGCYCDAELQKVSQWEIPEGMKYGWEILPGNNSVKIYPHQECGVVCAYFEVDALTI